MYDPIQKKWDLPSFSDLDRAFEISLIEEDKWIVRNVRKKIGERLELVIDVVQRILQPDTNSFADMYECKFFSGSDKDKLFVLFKHVMYWYRRSIELEIVQDEKSDAEFIRQALNEWLHIKKSVLPFVTKLKTVWVEREESKEHLAYLG